MIQFTICPPLLFATPPDTLDHFPSYRVEGGAPTFYKLIAETLRYPRSARQSEIIGTSIISFVLHPSGEISEWNIINSLGKEIDEEVIHVFKKTEKIWLPDSLEEKSYVLFFPVHFIINGHIYNLTAHSAGFMQEEIKLVAEGNTSRKTLTDQSLAQQANDLYQKQKYKPAMRHLNELIRRNPFSSELYKMRGYCRYMTDDKVGACEDYQKIETLLHQPIPPAARNICIGYPER
ncbi:MAG: energy transducer TonB [Bacteroidota bacterium]